MKVKRNDAVMTGILVTRFKMGLIYVEDLEHMAEDLSGSERPRQQRKCWRRSKVQPDIQRQHVDV